MLPCSVYEAPEMTMLDKRSVKLENVLVRRGAGLAGRLGADSSPWKGAGVGGVPATRIVPRPA
jgi:hypothetical protein